MLGPASAHSDAIKQSGSSCQQPNSLESISEGPFFWGLFFFFVPRGGLRSSEVEQTFNLLTVEVLSTWRNPSQRVIGVHIRQLLMHSALSNIQTQPGNRLASCCFVWNPSPRVCRTERLRWRKEKTSAIESSCLPFLPAFFPLFLKIHHPHGIVYD